MKKEYPLPIKLTKYQQKLLKSKKNIITWDELESLIITKTYKDKFDIVDKLVIHLAQSRAYIREKGLRNTLAWRAKAASSKPLTRQDERDMKWAIKFLTTKPIFIANDFIDSQSGHTTQIIEDQMIKKKDEKIG